MGPPFFHLENFKLTPGDVVTYYVSAKDARTESRSDMSFIQAEPFEREFSQSQQMAGGRSRSQRPGKSERYFAARERGHLRNMEAGGRPARLLCSHC